MQRPAQGPATLGLVAGLASMVRHLLHCTFTTLCWLVEAPG